MEKTDEKDYFKILKERKEESKVYSSHQAIGLELAEILEDKEHKSLYIKLAKTRGSENLIALARDIAEKKSVLNKGAYFMRVLHGKDKTKK